MATSAELMRTCAPLYPSFACESLSSVVLFCFFSYLSIIISSKQQLKAPGRDILRFVYFNVTDWATDTYRVLSRWPRMHEMDLGQRFRFCRRLNATICRLSAVAALISITRWLHVNNVNGFRYLGYAITCPLMQAELVLLIAPVVPFYKKVVILTSSITFIMLVSGYTASQFGGELFTTDWEDIIVDGNFHNLTTKGKALCPSMVCLSFLSFVQIPFLGFLYWRGGGSSSGKLPRGYPKLLLLTAISWWGFPAWWLLSYEGMSIIKSTWANGIGFVCLNMVSKGGFTLLMIGMVKEFKRKQQQQQQQQNQPEPGVSSLDSLPAMPGPGTGANEAAAGGRQERVLTTAQSLGWFVEHMRRYESGGGAPAAAAEPVPETKLADVKAVVVKDASGLSNDELVQELTRRLAKAQDREDREDSFGTLLDLQIRRACSQIAISEDSGED